MNTDFGRAQDIFQAGTFYASLVMYNQARLANKLDRVKVIIKQTNFLC